MDHGVLGWVFLCRDSGSADLIAIKMFHKAKIVQLSMSKDTLVIEKDILSLCKHLWIVGFYSSFQENNYFYEAIQYMEGSCIRKYITPKRARDILLIRFYSA